MSGLVVSNLVKTHGKGGDVRAVDGVSMRIEPGEMVALLGPSGCGKSTLLRTVAGLDEPTEGRVQIGEKVVYDSQTPGKSVPTQRRDIGLVFQNYSLWPHMTVEDNVGYPLRVRRVKSVERSSSVAEALELVRCAHLANRYPSQLSGGQQQRIALARALVHSPNLLLLDEPLSNLDALLRVELRDQLRELHRRLRFTGIYVTHDRSEAMTLGDRVAVMREGRVVQIATPDEVWRHPATAYVADFLGVRNQFDVDKRLMSWVLADGARLRGDVDQLFHQFRDRAALFLRPEQIKIDAAKPDSELDRGKVYFPPSVVEDTIFTGLGTEYLVKVGSSDLLVSDSRWPARFRPGDTVQPHFLIEDALVYSTSDHGSDHDVATSVPSVSEKELRHAS